MNVTLKKLQGSVFGAAIGDAVGVPFEFRSREEMMRCPATDMTGNGTYHMPIGTWSDDTTMILCTLDRLDESMDYDGIMRAFLSWVEKGEYTPHGSCFDIGGTTRRALENFARGAEPLRSGLDDNYSNGNGSLMRIIPAALYADAHGLSLPEAVKLAETLSSLTHAHAISRTGCGIFTCIALSLLKNADKSSVQEGIRNAAAVYTTESGSKGIEKYRRLLSDGFPALPEEAPVTLSTPSNAPSGACCNPTATATAFSRRSISEMTPTLPPAWQARWQVFSTGMKESPRNGAEHW